MALYLDFIFRFAGLWLFWFLLTGKTDGFHLVLGAAASLVITLVSCRRQTATTLKQAVSLFLFPGRCLIYGLWLLTRIIMAAWHVSCVILNPRLPINPSMIRHRTVLPEDHEKVIFGNSITLTPGTITAEIGDELLVHQLDPDSAGDIVSGLMEKQIARWFGDKEDKA